VNLFLLPLFKDLVSILLCFFVSNYQEAIALVFLFFLDLNANQLDKLFSFGLQYTLLDLFILFGCLLRLFARARALLLTCRLLCGHNFYNYND
jgi:hypothetical protein